MEQETLSSIPREEVYAAINCERDHQDYLDHLVQECRHYRPTLGEFAGSQPSPSGVWSNTDTGRQRGGNEVSHPRFLAVDDTTAVAVAFVEIVQIERLNPLTVRVVGGGRRDERLKYLTSGKYAIGWLRLVANEGAPLKTDPDLTEEPNSANEDFCPRLFLG